MITSIIKAADYYSDSILVSRESAQLLRDALRAAISSPSASGSSERSYIVTVDFEGVEGMAPSFLDELLVLFESLTNEDSTNARRMFIVRNPPARLSRKFEAIARGHCMSIESHADGSWSITKKSV